MVFFTCVLKIANYFLHFSLRNDELNVASNIFSLRKETVFLFFIAENNEWIKNLH